MKRKTYKCPVCGAKRINQGMANHIRGQAIAEVYQWYKAEVSYNNPTIPKIPHQFFIEKHTINQKNSYGKSK